jgi:hypothetical protein
MSYANELEKQNDELKQKLGEAEAFIVSEAKRNEVMEFYLCHMIKDMCKEGKLCLDDMHAYEQHMEQFKIHEDHRTYIRYIFSLFLNTQQTMDDLKVKYAPTITK